MNRYLLPGRPGHNEVTGAGSWSRTPAGDPALAWCCGRPMKPLAMLLVLLLLASCASGPKRPVFYPNAHSKAAGKARTERDVDQCMVLARDAGVRENRDGEVGKKAAAGALIGGIGAGAWGLVRGDAGERALAGALAGGGVGGVKGAVDSTELNPTFRKFVNRCLRDLGYDVIGWE